MPGSIRAFGSAPLRERPAAEAPASRRTTARLLRRHRAAAVGLALVGLFVLAAAAAPLLAPCDPAAVDPSRVLEGASLRHPLGTDHLGRDVLSRLVYGARWSLGAVGIATVLIVCIGVAVGVVAGYYGGWIDTLLMRIVDVLLALPGLLLALAVVGMLGPGLHSLLIGLVFAGWAGYARVVRGLVLGLRERPFIEAARCLGLRDGRILTRHVAPNILAPVAVLASLETGELILAVAALNFLGLGAQPPIPEWGAMLNDGRPFLFAAPRLMIYPGLAISAAAIGFNLLGEGIRDALDPRLAARP